MENKLVKSITDRLNNYCYLARDNDYINITEWPNEEGITIDLNGKQQFNLTYGEVEAIFYLKNKLNYEKELYQSKK
jgi:hypothetical protein